jgi:hypothetical protein
VRIAPVNRVEIVIARSPATAGRRRKLAAMTDTGPSQHSDGCSVAFGRLINPLTRRSAPPSPSGRGAQARCRCDFAKVIQQAPCVGFRRNLVCGIDVQSEIATPFGLAMTIPWGIPTSRRAGALRSRLLGTNTRWQVHGAPALQETRA